MSNEYKSIHRNREEIMKTIIAWAALAAIWFAFGAYFIIAIAAS